MDQSTAESPRRQHRVPMRELSPGETVKSFAEVSLGYSPGEAIEEARREEGADFTRAKNACPFGVDVAELVRRSAASDFAGAFRAVVAAHSWPGIMGRWCFRACEGAHSLGTRQPLNIGGLERTAADHGAHARQPFRAGDPSGKRVAILGAGSSGSATA
ncbi:MAG: hypothetical protein ACREFQ_04375 [Stellaceae bacterium]